MNGFLADPSAMQSWEFWALAAAAVIADLRPFPTPGARRRPTAVFVFVIMLVWGLGWAAVVQILAVVGASIRRRQGVERTVVAALRLTAAMSVAWAWLHALGASSFQFGQPLTASDGLVLVGTALAWFVVSYSIFLSWLRFRVVGSWRQVFTFTLGYELLGTGALLLLAPMFIGAPADWGLLLVIAPVLAISQLAWLHNKQGEQLRIDALTGLLNRDAIMVEIEELTAADRSPGRASSDHSFALLLIDLDRFKQVNDALGHLVGDRLLAIAAQRLRAEVRGADLVSRLGGDEFAIVMPHAGVAEGQTLAMQVADALEVPAVVEGQPLDINASIGVALFPDHGTDGGTLLRHAEVAMYQAKRQGKPIALYTAVFDDYAARLNLLADLRLALDDPARREEITLHYQPQVAIATGEVVGMEALLRWHHPVRGFVSVAEILAVAEQGPVIHRLTRRVIDDAVEQLAVWNADGLHLRVSVNVSARDLEEPNLVHHLASTLEAHRVEPRQLEIEVTETALMADADSATSTLHDLAALGIALSLDDFGTGYSSLAHVRGLPVSEIKIDRSFISRVATDPNDFAVVRSIISLAVSLGLRVVAEGVEDEKTCRMLAEAGCPVAQGWLFAKAMPARQLLAWLRDRVPDRPITHVRV